MEEEKIEKKEDFKEKKSKIKSEKSEKSISPEKKEYVVVPSKSRGRNQILNDCDDDKIDEEQLMIDQKIKQNAFNKVSEKEKIKDDYKKIYKEKYKDNFNNYKGDSKKIKILLIVIFILCFAFLIFSMIFSLLNINCETNIKGTSIMGIDVSGLTLDETKKMLNDKIANIMQNNIELKYKDDYTTTILLEQIDTCFNIDDVANQAYEIGRNGNIFENNYAILGTKLNGKNIAFDIEFNKAEFDKAMSTISTELPDCVVQSSYYIDVNTLVITSGKEGVIVDNDQIKNDLIVNISNQLKDGQNNPIYLPVKTEQPNVIDIDSIYKEVHREAQDAYCTDDPVAIYPDVYGVDFAISLEQAKEMIATKQDKYEIPLKVLEPKVKIQDLGEKAFPNLLGTFRTNFDNSASNRSTNIGLAAKSINGTILLPGEEFSYNKTVGDTTPEKGYKLGGAYLNGKVVQSYGGGICQVSSTLYNAVVLANLDVTMRYNHSSPVGYVTAGRDATVSYGVKDFKFKNSKKYPIKIVATSKNGVLIMEIYGISEPDDCEVSIESKKIQSLPYSVTYSYNDQMAKGTQKVQVAGANGYKSITYKIKKINGAVVSKEVLSQDTYNPMNRVIEVGTKE